MTTIQQVLVTVRPRSPGEAGALGARWARRLAAIDGRPPRPVDASACDWLCVDKATAYALRRAAGSPGASAWRSGGINATARSPARQRWLVQGARGPLPPAWRALLAVAREARAAALLGGASRHSRR